MDHKCSNLLLTSLPDESKGFILDRSQTISLPQKLVCFEAEERPAFAYFLESGFASLVTSMKSGETAEVEMIGREGMLGGAGLLASTSSVTPTRCIIQTSAQAHRIPIADFREAYRQFPAVRDLVLAFFQAEIAALSQIAGCHRSHEAEQRLARWLLMAQDRVGETTLHLTHEFLAEMLGTRRTTVTEVAGDLQRRGLIEYQRGTVIILNRSGLEAAACECYGIISRIYRNIPTS